MQTRMFGAWDKQLRIGRKFSSDRAICLSESYQAALAVAFGDLIGIGNEVHAQLSQQAAHYVTLLGTGAAGYNADLSLFLKPAF